MSQSYPARWKQLVQLSINAQPRSPGGISTESPQNSKQAPVGYWMFIAQPFKSLESDLLGFIILLFCKDAFN